MKREEKRPGKADRDKERYCGAKRDENYRTTQKEMGRDEDRRRKPKRGGKRCGGTVEKRTGRERNVRNERQRTTGKGKETQGVAMRPMETRRKKRDRKGEVETKRDKK